MLDADLLCDRVAFITEWNIVALDTPQNLKEKNSNHRIVVSYLYQGKRKEQTIEAPELKAGIPFAYDEIISIHSQEPTLEDVFIQYTRRGCLNVEKPLFSVQKRLPDDDVREILSGGAGFPCFYIRCSSISAM